MYEFDGAGGEWTRTARVSPDEGGARESFGSSIAVSGDRALVAAPNARVDGQYGIGAAYLFERTDGEWVQTARLTADDGTINDGFGHSVELAEQTAFVGASDIPKRSAGTVYVFERADGEWAQQATLTIPHPSSEEYFGHDGAIEASGDTLVVGASGASDGGTVHLFDRAGGDWTNHRILAPPKGGKQFGRSLAVSKSQVLIGHEMDQDGFLDGQVSAFDLNR